VTCDEVVANPLLGFARLGLRSEASFAPAIEPSVGSVGDSYDNAMAESVIGLYKTEVIRRRAPWRHVDAVEYATLEWVDWFNNRRLLEPIGYVPPIELESGYYESQSSPVMEAGLM
jgi:transposase InsO family protein